MTLWILVMTLTCIKGPMKGQVIDANFKAYKSEKACTQDISVYSQGDNIYLGQKDTIWTEAFKCKKELIK